MVNVINAHVQSGLCTRTFLLLKNISKWKYTDGLHSSQRSGYGESSG